MLSKTIESLKIDIQLLLHQLKDVRDILLQLMKKRKEMVIQSNESNFKDEDTTRIFDDRKPIECDSTIVDLMEKNTTLKEEMINLKREHEGQAIKLCEEIHQRKKAIEDKVMIEDDIRMLRNRLDEKIFDIQNLTNT